MIVKDFYIRNDQYRDLKKLKGTMSEHVRNAIDEYLKRLKKDKLNVSYSKS